MPRKSLARRALTANAVFSGVSGLALATLAPFWAEALLQSPPVWLSPALQVMGGGLVSFATVLAWLAAAPERTARWTQLVIWADLAWVAMTGVLLVTLWAQFTEAGVTLLIAVAAVVAVFGMLQQRGLRRLPAQPGDVTAS